MKRYRIVDLDFDRRAVLLETAIQASWDADVKAQWRSNQQAVRESIIHQFGVEDFERKVDDFVAMGPAPMSVLSFHNRFYREVRSAFAGGIYYPALLGAAALGERVLNHLIQGLREDFAHTPEYAKAVRKKSFDDWDWMIDTLESWGGLLPDAARSFRELKVRRHAAVHFRPELDESAREPAVEAIRLLSSIIEVQFSTFGNQPWFIPNTAGVSYVRKLLSLSPSSNGCYCPVPCLSGRGIRCIQCRVDGVWPTRTIPTCQ